MRGKKFLLALMSVMMMASVGVACGEDTPEEDTGASSSQTRDITITFDKTEATMSLFDTLTIEAGVKGADKSELVWTSSDEEVATVSQDGVVTPVGSGIVIIMASIDDVSADCVIVIGEIEGPIQLEAPETEFTLGINKSKALAVVGYAKTLELANGEFTYEIKEGEDDTVVDIDEETGVVTGRKNGTTKILVNATFDGMEAEAPLEITVTVIDIIKETLDSIVTVYENRMADDESLSIDLKDFEELVTVTKVTIDNESYQFTGPAESNKELKIAKSVLKDSVVGGKKQLYIEGTTETGKIQISGEMLYVDYAMGTVAELNAFGAACNANASGKAIYAILTDDIDYDGNSFTNVFPMASGVFCGTLDGQGYSISNVTFTHSMFPVTRSATIKNIAFVNIDKNTANGGGFLANELSNSLLENVYISARVTKHTAGGVGSVYGYGVNNTIKTSFFYLDYATNPGQTPIISYNVQGNETKFENVYALSTNSNGKLYTGTEPEVMDAVLYTSVETFKKEVSSIPVGFDPDYWTMEDGMLAMTAPDALPERVIVGEQFVAKNRGESLQLDLSGYKIDSLESVTIGGYKIKEYTYANNKLMVAVANMPKKGRVDVSLVAKVQGKTQKIKAKAYVVDYAIGTVAELNAFAAECNTNTEAKAIYAVLTANIDYAGASFTNVFPMASGVFSGTLDGQGYAISNVTFTHSMFPVTRSATIKNIAFVNLVKNTANGGGFLANELSYSTVENVYLSGKVALHTAGGVGSVYGYGVNNTLKNSVFNIDFSTNPNSTPVLSPIVQGTSTFENVYAISTNSNGQLYAGTTPTITNTKLYTSMDAFKAEVTFVPNGFNTEYWEMKDGKLVFKSAK